MIRSVPVGTWLLLALGSVVPAYGQGIPNDPIPLWPDGQVPGAVGTEPLDVPSIRVFAPPADKANGAAIVVCPGGGYGMLADEHEGTEVAEWLNSIGVTGVVLKYRLGPRYNHPAPLQDAQRAIRTVRARAAEWGIDPARVGIMGFSAGGHLASTAGTHFDAGNPEAPDPIDRQSSRPDVMVLAYPVIALATPYAHAGSIKNLLGDNPAQPLIEDLSNEQKVTKDTPPAFLAHTNEDAGVVPENSILFVLAMRRAGVPVEFHLFEKGQHGLGLGTGWPKHNIQPDPSFQAWPKLCESWLNRREFLKAPAKPE